MKSSRRAHERPPMINEEQTMKMTSSHHDLSRERPTVGWDMLLAHLDEYSSSLDLHCKSATVAITTILCNVVTIFFPDAWGQIFRNDGVPR